MNLSMKTFLLSAGAVLLSAPLFGLETQALENDWQVCPLKVAEKGLRKCPEPAADATWKAKQQVKSGNFYPSGYVIPAERKGSHPETAINTWYKRTFKVPASWKGKSVRVYQELNYVDGVVFINGKKVGDLCRPCGYLEISDFVNYGADNEIKIFYTNCYNGTVHTRWAYWGRDELPQRFNNFMSTVKIEEHTPTYVENVLVNTLWRERKMIVRCTIYSLKDTKGTVSVKVCEDAGRDASKAKNLIDGKQVFVKEFKLDLKKGEHDYEVTIPWENPTTWELNRPFLYNCEVNLNTAAGKCDTYKKFYFGFREIWREGKDIYLNGHIQRFRGFWPQGYPKDYKDIKKFGYNISYSTHRHFSLDMFLNVDEFENLDRAGVAISMGMPPIYFIHDSIRTDKEAEEQYRNHFKFWVRKIQNCPSFLWGSCGVNQICPEDNMKPDVLGQIEDKSGVALNIMKGRAIALEYHPNCLYYSHADGTVGDISSNNLYFNFTPLQEREEWLQAWNKKGIMPWYAAEFGAPYYPCWFEGAPGRIRTPEMTEWLAVYYGEKAYASESPDMLRFSENFTKSCSQLIHGGWVNANGGFSANPTQYDLFAYNPLGDEYVKMLIYRTNRAWRTYGLNGGLMYLTAWEWKDGNPTLERQRQANCDYITYLGGCPEVTDRTHAYYEGEDITKNLVFVWDGFGETKINADWKFMDASGKVLKSGKEVVTIKQGEIIKKPVTVKAPSVDKRTAYKFEVAFDAPEMDKTVKSDSFDLEVYPKSVPQIKTKDSEFAVYDPMGKDAAVLDALGMKYTKVDDLQKAVAGKNFKFILVGKFALDKAEFDPVKTAKRVDEGLRIFIMPQNASVWEAMGFTVEDAVARKLYNTRLAGVDDVDLAHWRGAPNYDKTDNKAVAQPYGNIMKHVARRGPRWTYTHAIAGLVFKIPQKTGFVPLVKGEFDMNYTALLRTVYGKGSVTFCSFDFEDRMGVCPAATTVAGSVFNGFVNDEIGTTRTAAFDGARAVELSKRIGLKDEKFNPNATNTVLVVGPDSKLTYQQIKDFASRKGNKVIVNANAQIALDAGLARMGVPAPTPAPAPAKDAKNAKKDAKKDAKNVKAAAPAKPAEPAKPQIVRHFVYRTLDRSNFDKFPFQGVTLNLLRWRLPQNIIDIQAKNGYTVTGDGVYAISKDGNILFCMITPKIQSDINGKIGLHGSATMAPTEDNLRQFFSLVMANWNVKPCEYIVARSLYGKPALQFEPIKNYYVLGPWPAYNPKTGIIEDNSLLMIDTIGTMGQGGESTDIIAEKMAIAGDVNPNPRFRPNALTYPKDDPNPYIDWRPTIPSEPDGFVNLRKIRWIDTQSFCTCYCVGYVEREAEGDVTFRFGVDWRGKVWVNGEEVLKTYGGGGPYFDHGVLIKDKMGGKTEGAYQVKIHLKKGKNVFTIKVGSGQTACAFYANIDKEIKKGDFVRKSVPELDKIEIYDTNNKTYDPYMYIYW